MSVRLGGERPQCEGRAHQSVLWVDGSEGRGLAQVGGVAQHGGVTRLHYRPSRPPWISGGVEAFCRGRRGEGDGCGITSHRRSKDNESHI